MAISGTISDILDRVCRIDHEHGTGEEAGSAARDQHAEMLAEAMVADVGEVLDVLDLRIGAPACLGEGEVEAHGVGRRLVAQGRERLANLRVCVLQTGVSSDGTTLNSRALPAVSASFTDASPAPTQVKSGDLSPALSFGPASSMGLPLNSHCPARLGHGRGVLVSVSVSRGKTRGVVSGSTLASAPRSRASLSRTRPGRGETSTLLSPIR